MPDSNNINETETTIEQCLQAFKSATYGEEVRDALVRAVNLCYAASNNVHLDNNNENGDYILYYIDANDNRIEVFNFSNYFPDESSANQNDTNLVVVPEPDGFSWKDSPLHGKILTDYKGNFKVNLDVSSFKNTGGTSVYVSPNGSDSNAGTETAPLQNIITAYETGATTIYLLPGIYPRNLTFFSDNLYKKITRNVNIIGLNTTGDIIISSHANSSMTQSGIYENTYRAERLHLTNVVDTKDLDEDGCYRKYKKVSTPEECSETEHSWCLVNEVVQNETKSIAYIHTHNNKQPTLANGIHLLNEDMSYSHDPNDYYSLFTITNGNVYLENITLIGGPVTLHAYKGDVNSTVNVYAKNCKFYVSRINKLASTASPVTSRDRNVVWMRGVDLAYFQNCEASLSESDGFNYYPIQFEENGPSYGTKAIEVNCTSCKNGNNIGGNDQGSTAHDDCRVIRVHGISYKNYGANFGDAKGCQTWNIGCIGFESHCGPGGTEAQHSNFMSYPNTEIWCDSCTGFGSTCNLGSAAEWDGTTQIGEIGLIYLRNPNFTGKLLNDTSGSFPYDENDVITYY